MAGVALSIYGTNTGSSIRGPALETGALGIDILFTANYFVDPEVRRTPGFEVHCNGSWHLLLLKGKTNHEPLVGRHQHDILYPVSMA